MDIIYDLALALQSVPDSEELAALDFDGDGDIPSR